MSNHRNKSTGQARLRASVSPWFIVFLLTARASADVQLIFGCDAENDLYRAIVAGGQSVKRFDDAKEAIAAAGADSTVLVLAGGYPEKRTGVDAALLTEARAKGVRLFIEYPDAIPGLKIGEPRTAAWERVVVASDALRSTGLPRLRILSAHACSYLPIADIDAPLLTLGQVAGYDRAVYGLPREHFPILFRAAGGELVATTKLSSFVTSRYAPGEQWARVWEFILRELGDEEAKIVIEPTVKPMFGKSDPLPKDAERAAVSRFAKWIARSGLLIAPQRQAEYQKLLATNVELTAPPAADEPPGDGSLGILEGYASHILPDGRQMRRTPIRADCQAESAMVLALAEDERSRTIAKNLLDFVYFKSDLHGGVRGDPKHPAYGLIAWGTGSAAWKVANYGDDNARTLLGTMLAAACLKSDAWDAAMLKALLANLRTTGKFGFRGDRIDIPALEQHGWRHFRDAETVNYGLNFEAYLWACYLWAYQQTGERQFLDKTRTAIRMTMAAYPNQWRWADNMERARILLPLAWIARIEDTAEHRGWLKRVATDLIEHQDACGAIPERLGGAGTGAGHYVVPASNEAYGTSETPLIQRNGDPVSDQLYTSGFALLGLHEAVAVTGDAKLREAEDKLAAYLVRIQVRSEKHPQLDGAWFRAFDFGQWDYWASSADVGWGAWSIEAGWCQAWTAATLGLREMKTSLWEVTANSRIEAQMKSIMPLMR